MEEIRKSYAPPARVPAEKLVRDIRRDARKQHSAEDKIRIVLEGLRGKESIAALSRREATAESLYDAGSKECLEAGKRRLTGDTARAAPPVMRSRRSATRPARWQKSLPNRRADFACSTKHDLKCRRLHMSYYGAGKLEIIRLIEQSHLPQCQDHSRQAHAGTKAAKPRRL